MSDDNLLPARSPHGDQSMVPAEHHGFVPAPSYGQQPYDPDYDADTEGLDLRRYLYSLVRFKWLILLALVIGAGASYWVWSTTPVEYRAEGALWIETGRVAFEPIQSEGIAEGSAWIELLRSYAVLDSVVLQLRRHISAPGGYGAAFRGLGLTGDFTAGSFELHVDPNGVDYALTTPEGASVIERGRLGGPVGEALGYDWTPPAGAFPAGEVIPFSVRRPRAKRRRS